MQMTRTIAVLVVLAVMAAPTVSLELPPPPDGYSWTAVPEIGGALLLPEGWAFRRLEVGGQLAYFVTKKPFDPPETFETGISLNMIQDVPGRAGMQPSQFAQKFVETVQATKSVEQAWTNSAGPRLRGWGVQYTESFEGESYRFYNLVIANDATGTAIHVVFESPVRSWEEDWAVVEKTVQTLVIDDEY